jgi:chromosome transmission fidelity protein 1
MNDYLDQLFPYLDNSNNTAITTLSCGHVIPPTNLFVSPIVSSFSYNNNKTTTKEENFTFTFSNRNKNSIISALGHSILKLLPHIPDGAVAFFPSYSYLEQVVGFWQKTNAADGDGDGCQGETLWTRMNRIKPIFKESQQQAIAGTEEDVLTAYTSAIVNDKNNNNDNTSSTRSKKAKGTAEGGKGGGGGAFLLAVIGGRLSEGINFSDNLGRCIMVIGLPFPNPNTAEWKAKTAYLEDKQRVAAVANKRTMTTTTVMRGGGGNGDTAAVGREFAENVCMRAVNQAIGRAVRHKDDWSAILLFDTRYAQKRISDKLPGWIRASLRGGVAGSGRLHEVEAGLKEFYARKKEDDLRL